MQGPGFGGHPKVAPDLCRSLKHLAQDLIWGLEVKNSMLWGVGFEGLKLWVSGLEVTEVGRQAPEIVGAFTGLLQAGVS